ncbi:MAG: hypothetical protein KIS85_09595 [Anaerolineales bacterium]|nr:hypothetical protein [Anaerolineales bacterium]
MSNPNRRLLETWLLIHAIITLAAGLVLIFAPGVIPSTVGIELPAQAHLLAYFLGAAEIAIALLSFGARKIQDPQSLTLIIWTFIVFHAATAAVELYDMLLHGSSPVLWANVVVRVVAVWLFVHLSRKSILA